jgi:hypothetical protein
MSWPAGTRFEARCAVHRDDAPACDHECGIYAFKTRALAEELLRRYTGVRHRYGREYQELPPVRQGRPIALGSVSLWGRIRARERGYRAQDIPSLILQKNLFGLEIDNRAAQLRSLRRRRVTFVNASDAWAH